MDKCSSESLLSGKNIKITRQRVSILDHIISRESSFCANDLYAGLKDSIDLVTIYRNLQLLCEEKILREVMSKEDRLYFELACVHNPVHPHFYCSSCKKILCMKSNSNYSASKKLNLEGNFIVHETVLQYSGICPECQA